MQLHRVGPVREVRMHCCIPACHRKPLEGPDGQRLPAVLLPGKLSADLRSIRSAATPVSKKSFLNERAVTLQTLELTGAFALVSRC